MAFDMDNYQYLVKRFKKDTANQMYLLLGLSGEVGELHSKAAKCIGLGDPLNGIVLSNG